MADSGENKHVWSAPERIAALSKEPFGIALMQRVAERLQNSGKSMCYCHREYCGHGLFFEDGKFQLAEVQDGDPRHTLSSWETVFSFIAFWSQQSDYTCSGADAAAEVFFAKDSFNLNNQRITRERLKEYAQA